MQKTNFHNKKNISEKNKVSIRNIRREANEELKKKLKESLKNLLTLLISSKNLIIIFLESLIRF